HDADRLGVAGLPGARLAVRGVGRRGALVADGRDVDARQRPERLLGAPEAAHGDVEDLEALGVRRRDRAAVDVVLEAGREDRPTAPGKNLGGAGHGWLAEQERHARSLRPPCDALMPSRTTTRRFAGAHAGP